jgi:DNA-binding response OmpR family regulator
MAKILLIDDDPDVRTVMNVLLKKNGHEVETASSRDQAFSKLKEFKPAVILLDVLLSGADGRTICREIKQNEATSKIAVIMFSAHPGAADKIDTYGADDFVAKPFNTEVLLDKITRFAS